jgi:hypothetical protein
MLVNPIKIWRRMWIHLTTNRCHWDVGTHKAVQQYFTNIVKNVKKH